MVIDAVKNASMTYQQGSTIGKDTVAAEKVQPKEKISVTVPSMPEDVSPSKAEFASSNRQKEYSPGEQAVSDKPNGGEVPKGNEAMRKAVEEINKNAKNSEAIFGIHDATNRVTIKIVDKDSKKVIKEFPPEKTLDMIAKVWEMAGLMVDEKR